uniref:NADP-dependent oxidoreductase domain-containing protein n=1 Tax=Aromatoleum buckelii TaxID=200254 RepID=A0ABX1N5R3_9RHOO
MRMIERTNPSDPAPSMTRANFLRLAAGTLAAAMFPARPSAAPGETGPRMQTRPVPATGEALPVVGLGTYQGFDVAPGSDAYERLPGVLDALFKAGGSVIDSSPMYGRAERTVGELLAQRQLHRHAFVATKVWTSGRKAGARGAVHARRPRSPLQVQGVHRCRRLPWRRPSKRLDLCRTCRARPRRGGDRARRRAGRAAVGAARTAPRTHRARVAVAPPQSAAARRRGTTDCMRTKGPPVGHEQEET